MLKVCCLWELAFIQLASWYLELRVCHLFGLVLWHICLDLFISPPSFLLYISYNQSKARHIDAHGISLLHRIQDMLSVPHVEISQIPS